MGMLACIVLFHSTNSYWALSRPGPILTLGGKESSLLESEMCPFTCRLLASLPEAYGFRMSVFPSWCWLFGMKHWKSFPKHMASGRNNSLNLGILPAFLYLLGRGLWQCSESWLQCPYTYFWLQLRADVGLFNYNYRSTPRYESLFSCHHYPSFLELRWTTGPCASTDAKEIESRQVKGAEETGGAKFQCLLLGHSVMAAWKLSNCMYNYFFRCVETTACGHSEFI